MEQHMFESFLASLQKSLLIGSLIITRILSLFMLISRFSAISRSSMKSLGRLFCR